MSDVDNPPSAGADGVNPLDPHSPAAVGVTFPVVPVRAPGAQDGGGVAAGIDGVAGTPTPPDALSRLPARSPAAVVAIGPDAAAAVPASAAVADAAAAVPASTAVADAAAAVPTSAAVRATAVSAAAAASNGSRAAISKGIICLYPLFIAVAICCLAR